MEVTDMVMNREENWSKMLEIKLTVIDVQLNDLLRVLDSIQDNLEALKK